MNYEEFKEKVKSASDITDIIGKYVDLKKSGANYKGLCPFHGEKTPSFFVMPGEQFYYCYGCHRGGDVFKFICDYNHTEFNDAVKELAQYAGIDIPEKFDYGGTSGVKAGEKNRLFEIYKISAKFYYENLFSHDGLKALEYLKKRGLTKNITIGFGLGYASGGNSLHKLLLDKGYSEDELKKSGLFSYKSGKARDIFFNRLIFPIMDRSSRVIAFGGRILTDGQPKYLNSPETIIYSKKNNLYGIQRAQRVRKNRIFLVEGYMDVISMHMAGYHETVASLGTALTNEQADIISRMADKVYLIYDADDAGINAMKRAIPILKSKGLFVNIVNMKPYKDPDELIKSEGKEGIERRLEKSQNAFYFEIECLEKEYDRSDPSETAAFEKETAAKIAALTDRFEREQYIKGVSARFGIDEKLLNAEVNRIGEQNSTASGIIEAKRPYVRNSYLGEASKKEKADAYQDEKNVLMAMVKTPSFFNSINKYINPNDFTPGIIKNAADIVWQYGGNSDLKVSDILSHFEDYDQNDLGKLFYNEMYDNSDILQKKKFISESLKSMLLRIQEKKINEADSDDFLKMMEEKNKLTELDINL